MLAATRAPSPETQSDLALLVDGNRVLPATGGDYLTEFDRLEHVPGGIEFAYRLRFDIHSRKITIRVKQRFTSLPNEAGQSGFRRRWEIERLPEGASCELSAIAGEATLDAGGRTAVVSQDGRRLQVTLTSPADARFVAAPRGALVVLDGSARQPLECEWDCRVNFVADEFAPRSPADRSLPLQTLEVVPGFEAVRLPLTDEAMPTGLAWRNDGTLVVSSLAGRVWLAYDTDGDGLEDRLAPFSDELAAPYGVAASGEAIDVINKYGLLRLWDTDGDGHADRTQLLASGWGHTRDYHDWAIGLPRDALGNYYVALPCQQDDRSAAAATLRGAVIKLVARPPTDDDPRRFTIEPLAGGLRFPHGIALSPSGDLFVTDNQGNYTPFNELNHIVKGGNYGFINRLERLRPPRPVRPAAIEIPHPWTRSVNGICFLPTGRGEYGPLAGHLIGCEYDTRRLVRMSLERVGGDWQGAVYPFSREAAPGEETFEGPLVCQVAPDGDLYVGNIRDSGWGAGSNTGSLVRLRPRGQLPPGIAEVRAAHDGFTLLFTTAVDAAMARDAANYAISSYRRLPTPAYGGPDLNRRVEQVRSVEVSHGNTRAHVRIDSLRPGFVYEFQLRPLARGQTFFPAEAYYTLRQRTE